jgi:transcription antitermination factor NusG
VAFSTKTPRDSDGGATVVSETPASEVDTNNPCWYAFQTRPRYEKKTDTHLRRKGLETFLPLLRQIHRWSDRRKLVEVPLFTGYGFVRIAESPDNRLEVLRTPGVLGLVGAQNTAAAIPAAQIENLRQLLSADVTIAGIPFLTAGKRVRIRGGALDGIEGILQENDGKHLVISVDALQRSIAIKVEGYSLELV